MASSTITVEKGSFGIRYDEQADTFEVKTEQTGNVYVELPLSTRMAESVVLMTTNSNARVEVVDGGTNKNTDHRINRTQSGTTFWRYIITESGVETGRQELIITAGQFRELQHLLMVAYNIRLN